MAAFPLNINTYAIQGILLKCDRIDFVGFLTDSRPTDELKFMANSIGIGELKIIDKQSFLNEDIETVLIIDDQGYDDAVVRNLVTELNSLNREAVIIPFLQEKYSVGNTDQESFFEGETIDEVLDIIPVVSVMSVGENAYKLETQMYIDNLFVDYKVLNITPKGCSIDTRFIPVPRELYSVSISFSEKIQLFRRFLSKILTKYNFDLLTLSIPGSIIPNDAFFNELALVMSYAVSIDINIINIFSNFDTRFDVLKTLDNMCKYKYNSDLNLFNIVPICSRYGEAAWGKTRDFYSINTETQKNILRDEIDRLKYSSYKIFTINRDILKSPSEDFFLQNLTNNIEIL